MDVEIGEVVSTVRAVDGDGLLAPQTLDRIVRAVLRVVDERDAHRQRVAAERRVGAGVAAEQEADRP